MEDVGIFCGPLIYFRVIWDISSRFGMFTKKNLASLEQSELGVVTGW
jgi:hypothetical protein